MRSEAVAAVRLGGLAAPTMITTTTMTIGIHSLGVIPGSARSVH